MKFPGSSSHDIKEIEGETQIGYFGYRPEEDIAATARLRLCFLLPAIPVHCLQYWFPERPISSDKAQSAGADQAHHFLYQGEQNL